MPRPEITVLLGLLLLASAAHATPPAQLGARIDTVMARWSGRDTPGCSVGVVQQGRLIHARGYGLANLEYAAPNTPDTVFEIASTSKQFTAAAVLMLAADGKLALDGDVRQYLPELPAYPGGKIITPRHLLTHTSGLRDYGVLMTLAGWGDDMGVDDAVATVMRQKALEFTPGEHMAYCNTGYLLLAKLVERVAGTSFARFLAERIFRPLGMNRTHVHDDRSLVVPGRATGHVPASDGTWRIAPKPGTTVGDASVYTTVRDMARWAANFDAGTVGGASLQAQLLAPGKLASGEQLAFASGLMLGSYRGLPTVYHPGAYPGYRAQLLRFPSEQTSIIVLCNTENGRAVPTAEAIADVVLERALGPAPRAARSTLLSSAQLDAWVGSYRDPQSGERIAIARQGDRLVVQAPTSQSLVADDPRTFSGSADVFTFKFQFEGVRPHRTLIRTTRSSLASRAERRLFTEAQPAKPPSPVQPDTYVGRFHSDELAADFEITSTPSGLILRGRGLQGPLDALGPDRFACKGVGILEFLRNDNVISGFVLRRRDLAELRFARNGCPTR